LSIIHQNNGKKNQLKNHQITEKGKKIMQKRCLKHRNQYVG